MDLRVLEYFLAAAAEENISHAAEQLHVSQPTVSRQLMELEEELGRKLFVRSNKKITLTEDGILFRETAQDILRLYEKAKQENSGSTELSGDLYIGAAEIESFDDLAEKITSFKKLHPGVRFHLYSGNAEEITAMIDRGTIDLGMILKSVNTMKYEILDTGITERWGILVRSDHPLAKKESVSVKDLKKEPLLIPENTALRNDIREWLGTEKADTYTLVKNAIIMTKKCGRVTVCLQMNSYLPEGTVFVPITPARVNQVFMVWKKKPVYSAAMDAFLKHLVMHNGHETSFETGISENSQNSVQ